MRNEQTRARLEQISLTVSDDLALSAEEEQWIELGEETLQQFWDQWYRRPSSNTWRAIFDMSLEPSITSENGNSPMATLFVSGDAVSGSSPDWPR